MIKTMFKGRLPKAVYLWDLKFIQNIWSSLKFLFFRRIFCSFGGRQIRFTN